MPKSHKLKVISGGPAGMEPMNEDLKKGSTNETETQTGEATTELQKKIQELEAQVKEKEQKYLYLYAEFENFKKRSIKERSDLMKFGWESLAHDLLQVVDNLERALAHSPPGSDQAITNGIQMVLNQFTAALNRQNVLPIQSVNQSFDPNVHEAVGAEPSEQPAGTVIREQLRGYTLHGRLLRPARVIVSEGPAKEKNHSPE